MCNAAQTRKGNTMPKTVTLRQLKKLGACEDQQNTFKALFGESVIVTVDLAIAHAGE